VSYLKSFPPKFRKAARTFRAISRLWYVDKVHRDNCACECCWAPQRSLF
jgi:hypothetical protein